MFKSKMDSQVSFFPASFTIQIIPGKFINELGQAFVDIPIFIIRPISVGCKQLVQQSRLPGNPVMLSCGQGADGHLSPLALSLVQHCPEWQSSLCSFLKWPKVVDPQPDLDTDGCLLFNNIHTQTESLNSICQYFIIYERL